MDWFVSDMGGDKFPRWMRTFGISKENGEVFVPAAIAGDEREVGLRAKGNGVPCFHHNEHAYVPATWLSRAFPGTREVCEKLTLIARNNVPSQATASEVVTQYTLLAPQLAPQAESDTAIARMLRERGFTWEQSRDALWFTPIAFGRRVLQSKGMTFSEEFFVFSPDGEILQKGRLLDNEIYRAAIELAPALLSDSVIKHVAFQSPEIRSFMEAISKGSNPTDLKGAPVVFFSGRPTSAGLERARRMTRSYFGLDRDGPPSGHAG